MTAVRPAADGRLQVVADLTLSVDGMTSTVTGRGSELRIDTPDPARLLDAVAHAELPAGVGRVDSPRALGRIAEQLGASGLTLRVAGPRGDVLTMGDVSGSLLGRLVTGSPLVQMGRWAAVRPLLGAAVRRRTGARAPAAAGLAAGLAVLAAITLRRRRTG